ncbi:MAG TPA: hypothetical protein VJ724_05135, partial [Tahibacter sp.]|nr:hypothetical protein [Tahibacter sp.]
VNVIDCRDDATGAARWSATLGASDAATPKFTPPPAPPDPDDYQLLDDGSLIAVQADTPTSHTFLRFDATGVERVRKTGNGAVASLSLHRAGWATVSLRASDGKPALVRYDRDGNSVALDQSGNTLGAIELVGGSTAADGSVHAIAFRASAAPWAPRTPERELFSIKASGALAWKRAYESTYANASIVTTAQTVHVAETGESRDSADDPVRSRLLGFALADGATLATSVDTLRPPYVDSAIALSADGAIVAFAAPQDARLRIARYDVRTGAPLDPVYLACTDFCASVRAIALDAAGVARIALDVSDRALGRTVAVLSRRGIGKELTDIRIDQRGVTGAWWAPYANGEGFALDFLPESRTLFMPWFTFARDGGNGADAQRWYVVQGAVAPNATYAELAITETTGGEFDAGPPVAARRVGTATLFFSDCDNGTLRYAFDGGVNGGAAGTITLSRLGPALADCVLADGTTRPGNVAPASNGFDARLSGSWFEPATSGQGLQFVVQPNGVFFAPWFTFRLSRVPSPPMPSQQRWFTVQGSLAGARDGAVTLPIVMTTGGAFDDEPTGSMTIVGNATVTVRACDRATLDYRFDRHPELGFMANATGTIGLVKAGGCTP